MSNTQVRSETAIETPSARRVDMKLEVVVIPVSDVDRSKRFYGGLGWRLDADFVTGDAFRGVQFTPPGSGTSITGSVKRSAARRSRSLISAITDSNSVSRPAATSRSAANTAGSIWSSIVT